jgi:hypothetical protein
MSERGLLTRPVVHSGIMALLVLVNGWAQVYHGDLTIVYGGVGWDGNEAYAPFARDFPGSLAGEVPHERMQRLLPSYLVWLSFQALGIEHPGDGEIIAAFRIMNAVCLVLSILVWHLIGNTLGLGLPGRWFGFLAIFVNFGLGKVPWYYPVLLDCPTLLCGCLLCLVFLRRWLFSMFWIVVVASMVSSTIHIWSLPLFLCRSRVHPQPVRSSNWAVRLLIAGVVAVGVAGPIVSCLILEHRPTDSGLQMVWPLFPLSVIAAATGLGLAFEPLLSWDVFVRPLRLLRGLLTPGLGLWLLAGLAVRLICEVLKPGSSMDTTRGLLAFVFDGGSSIFMRSTVLPLIHLVGHVLCAGPMVVLAMLHWRSLCRRFGGQGLSMLLFMSMMVILTLDSETRHFFVPLPFLAAFLAREIEDLEPPEAFWGCFVGSSILLSTVWLPVFQTMLWLTGKPHEMSVWFYGAFWGPWITEASYLAGLFLTGILLNAFWWMLCGNKQLGVSPDPVVVARPDVLWTSTAQVALKE